MNTVDAIKSKATIKKILDYLCLRNQRDYMLVYMGIQVGLRISDLLSLSIGDVLAEARDGRRYIRTHIKLRERKTGKERNIRINRAVADELREYLRPFTSRDMKDPLFPSRKKAPDGGSRPIKRDRAYKIIKSLKTELCLQEKVGTHTLRKTWGYWAYQQTKDVGAIQAIMGHDSGRTTLRYIGIDQDQKDDIYSNVTFQRGKRA